MESNLAANLVALAWPGRLAPLLNRRRAQAIVARVRVFASLFAVLTLAWIGVDALVFNGETLAALAVMRAVTGGAFGVLAVSCRIRAPAPRQARLRLGALFVIPGLFFVFSGTQLPHPLPSGWLGGVAAAYTFFPFVLAAGIGAFPLAVVESASLAAILLAVEATVLAATGVAGGLEVLWLLVLIADASTFAAASQLKLMAALIEQAIRDPLTGCLRRESGVELLEAQLLLAVRQGEPLAVLFADIDFFKSANDTFGHDAGDRVLAATAAALRAMGRESDTLIRWGGEEFVLLLPHTTSTEAVTLIARLRATGLGTLPDGKPVTVSIGVAENRGDATGGVAELVALADHRMYLAKQAGRNRYVLDGGGEAYRILVRNGASSTQAPSV